VTSKSLKLALYLISGLVIGLVAYVVIGLSFFSYKENRLVSGCEEAFCIGQTKAEIEIWFEGKYSFKEGIMVPYDPTILPSKFVSNNHANSLQELIETNRWTIVHDEEGGWDKFVHLNFKDDTLYQIDVVNYGPFYIDP